MTTDFIIGFGLASGVYLLALGPRVIYKSFSNMFDD